MHWEERKVLILSDGGISEGLFIKKPLTSRKKSSLTSMHTEMREFPQLRVLPAGPTMVGIRTTKDVFE